MWPSQRTGRARNTDCKPPRATCRPRPSACATVLMGTPFTPRRMTRLRHTGWSFAFYSMRGDSVEALDGSTPLSRSHAGGSSYSPLAENSGQRAGRQACTVVSRYVGALLERVAHERTSVGSTLLEAPPRTEREPPDNVASLYPPVPLKCRGPWDGVLDGLGRPRRVIGDLDGANRTHPTRRASPLAPQRPVAGPRWLLTCTAGTSSPASDRVLAGTFASVFAMPRACPHAKSAYDCDCPSPYDGECV